MIESYPTPQHNKQLEFPFITTAIATHFPVTQEMWAKYKDIEMRIGSATLLLAEVMLEKQDFNSEVRRRDG
jgi:hypothetical protein